MQLFPSFSLFFACVAPSCARRDAVIVRPQLSFSLPLQALQVGKLIKRLSYWQTAFVCVIVESHWTLGSRGKNGPGNHTLTSGLSGRWWSVLSTCMIRTLNPAAHTYVHRVTTAHKMYLGALVLVTTSLQSTVNTCDVLKSPQSTTLTWRILIQVSL